MTRVLVAGSGKLGRNLGRFLVEHGLEVTWLSRDAERLAACERRLRRQLREHAGSIDFRLVDEDLPACDWAIESIEESLAAKRALHGRMAERLPAGVPLLSNSSSFLPRQLHPRAAGLHFFFPVEMSGLVEWIAPAAYPAALAARVGSLLERVGLQAIAEDEASAFAVNRLLLPLQCECMRALRRGCAPEEIDRASRSPLLPVGQLALMDAIGLDVLRPSVANYLVRLPEPAAGSHRDLLEGLEILVAAGRLGQKNGQGLLVGAPLPWARDPAQPLEADFAAELDALARNTLAWFLARGELSPADLRLAMSALFGVDSINEAALRPADLRLLERRHLVEGRTYWQPAPSARD